MKKFHIKKLLVSGAGCEDAVITFSKGLNVISGPSNTGNLVFFVAFTTALEDRRNHLTIHLDIRPSNCLLKLMMEVDNQ